MDILELAGQNRAEAYRIIEESGIIEIWQSLPAEIHLVGSLRNGLFMKHRDIDFHLYSPVVDPANDFAAMARLAANPAVKRIEYGNLLDTEEACLEWHAWYEDRRGALWQIDMIHMPKGSRYDGYFEQVADRIAAVLTPETRETILTLKYETPDTDKIMGIEYYVAVLRDGVRSWDEFMEWRRRQPAAGVIEWIP